MPSNYTTTTSLADSLPVVLMAARQVREQLGQDFVSCVERKPFPMGKGSTYREVDFAKISSQSVPQGTTLDNPQELSDTLISVEPTMIGVHIILTVEAEQYMDTQAAKEIGGLSENANRRKKDRDGLDTYDGATVTGGGTGTTLNSGVIAAMVAQIQGDVNESALETEEIYALLHGFQIYDLRTELTSGVGTYVLNPGMSSEAFAKGNGSIREVGGAIIRRDNNIQIDSTPDAHGGVHAKSGIVLVEVTGKKRAFTKTMENMAGAQAMWLYDWYGYMERSAGNLVKRILCNATAPTSG